MHLAAPATAAVACESPYASVLIVSYNAGPALASCLRSLLVDPCAGPDVEIIVVDNASTDGSIDGLAFEFPQVRLVRSPDNLGFGGGSNLAARHARGRYLAFLNPDVLIAPGWLDALLSALENNPRAGLATSRILLLSDPQRINACGNEMHYTGLTLCRGMGLPADSLNDLEEVTAVSGAAFAIRRDLFLALGGFCADFFLYMEDTDLSWRARLAGYRCVYVPCSTVYHDYTLRFGPGKTFYQERNRYLLLLRGFRPWTLLLLCPALLLAEIVTWGFILLRDRANYRNKIQAYLWTLRHRAAILADRRRVQAMRRVSDRDLLARCTYRLAYEQTGAGLSAGLAHHVFDPLFHAWQRLSLTLMRW